MAAPCVRACVSCVRTLNSIFLPQLHHDTLPYLRYCMIPPATACRNHQGGIARRSRFQSAPSNPPSLPAKISSAKSLSQTPISVWLIPSLCFKASSHQQAHHRTPHLATMIQMVAPPLMITKRPGESFLPYPLIPNHVVLMSER